jgi:hypothetical protein
VNYRSSEGLGKCLRQDRMMSENTMGSDILVHIKGYKKYLNVMKHEIITLLYRQYINKEPDPDFLNEQIFFHRKFNLNTIGS